MATLLLYYICLSGHSQVQECKINRFCTGKIIQNFKCYVFYQQFVTLKASSLHNKKELTPTTAKNVNPIIKYKAMLVAGLEPARGRPDRF